MKVPVIETERLLIGHGDVEDYVKIHEYDFNALQNIKGVMEYIKMDPQEVRSWFNNDIDSWYKRLEDLKHYNFVVYLKESMEPIADIGYDRNIPEINAIEVSEWVHPRYWGHGYAKEALIATMKYIYDEGFDNIIYGYVEGNEKSRMLNEKIGFEKYKEDVFRTNYGETNQYITIMSKEKFKDLYISKSK